MVGVLEDCSIKHDSDEAILFVYDPKRHAANSDGKMAKKPFRFPASCDLTHMKHVFNALFKESSGVFNPKCVFLCFDGRQLRALTGIQRELTKVMKGSLKQLAVFRVCVCACSCLAVRAPCKQMLRVRACVCVCACVCARVRLPFAHGCVCVRARENLCSAFIFHAVCVCV